MNYSLKYLKHVGWNYLNRNAGDILIGRHNMHFFLFILVELVLVHRCLHTFYIYKNYTGVSCYKRDQSLHVFFATYTSISFSFKTSMP